MSRFARYTLIGLTVTLAGFGAWLAFRPIPSSGNPPVVGVVTELSEQPVAQLSTIHKILEARLTACLGLTAREVLKKLDLTGVQWHWTDEPPGILRGVSYNSADGRHVILYMAETEPLFRKFSERFDWDYEAFLECRVGGIRYTAGEVHLDIGTAVPWQWRRPDR